jgi:hypothetical protein
LFNVLKTDLAELIGLSKDALHIHLGLLVFLAAMLVFRRSPASILPWLCVLALELVNEAFDILHEFAVLGAVKDMANTMLWPTIILLLARFAPRIFAWSKSARSSPPAEQVADR